MTNSNQSRTAAATTWVWIALVAITVGSWWLAPAHSGALTQPSTPITAVVLLLAIIKCRLIIRHFMEVRTAPRRLGYATDAWLATLFGTVFVIYLI